LHHHFHLRFSIADGWCNLQTLSDFVPAICAHKHTRKYASDKVTVLFGFIPDLPNSEEDDIHGDNTYNNGHDWRNDGQLYCGGRVVLFRDLQPSKDWRVRVPKQDFSKGKGSTYQNAALKVNMVVKNIPTTVIGSITCFHVMSQLSALDHMSFDLRESMCKTAV
jgi:hypothetical protein